MTLLWLAPLLTVLAACVAWRVEVRARRVGDLLDRPNRRSSSEAVTPRGGGLGIVAAAGLGWIATGALVAEAKDVAPMIGLAAGAAIVAAAGLADDLKRIVSWRVKLGLQAIAAVAAIAAGLTVDFGLPPAAGAAIAFVWLVGAANAYNFMDGLDGLAGSVGVVAGLGLAASAAALGNPAAATAAVALAAGCAGFLALNLPPARIFMGDVGSQFLGFAFAAIGLWIATAEATGAALLVAPLILAAFLFDTALTLIDRIRRGERPFEAHKEHLYQRLNQAGASHGRVAMLHAAFAAVHAAAAVAALVWAPTLMPWLVGAAVVAQAIHARAAIGRVRAAESRAPPPERPTAG